MKVEGKAIDVPLSPAAAADSLDGLAKEVYFRVFDWLVEKINDSTHCAKGTVAGTIGLLVRGTYNGTEQHSFLFDGSLALSSTLFHRFWFSVVCCWCLCLIVGA